MKIENRELLEQLYANKLAVFRDPKSSLEQVFKAYKSRIDDQPDISRQINFFQERRFQRHVVDMEFRKRISTFVLNAKTFDEALAVWKCHPRDRYREQAAMKAISLANCQQALDLYRRIHYGYAGEQALARALRLAKTQDELWQVAVHSRTCGNKKFWKQAVKKIARKLK